MSVNDLRVFSKKEQLLANYLMIPLKIIKAILPVCDVKNSNRVFYQ